MARGASWKLGGRLVAGRQSRTVCGAGRNRAGGFLGSTDLFLQSSLGNLPSGSVSITLGQGGGGGGGALLQVEAAAALLLLAYMLGAHAALIHHWRRAHDRMAEVEDYTVWVTGLPRVATTSKLDKMRADLLAECERRWGRVARLTLPRSGVCPRSAHVPELDLYKAVANLNSRRAEERQAFAVYYGLRLGPHAGAAAHARRTVSERERCAAQWRRVARACAAVYAAERTVCKGSVLTAPLVWWRQRPSASAA